MEHETSKIVIFRCQDCGGRVGILCNESATIMAVRCPRCQTAWEFKNTPKS